MCGSYNPHPVCPRTQQILDREALQSPREGVNWSKFIISMYQGMRGGGYQESGFSGSPWVGPREAVFSFENHLRIKKAGMIFVEVKTDIYT